MKSNNPEASLRKNKAAIPVGASGARSTSRPNNPDETLGKKAVHYEGASDGLKSTGKTNHETTTLRSGNLPKAEAVRHAQVNVGAARRQAEKQNTSDGGDYAKKRNVIPNESDESLVAVGIVKVKE